MDSSITQLYGNKVRVRVCGICWSAGKLLLVNHSRLAHTDFWAPPGGGVEFGQSVEENLKREFEEETGLEVTIDRFLFGCEFLNPPLHSLELFFSVNVVSGELKVGQDPELPIIKDVRFLTPGQITQLKPDQLHGIFRFAATSDEFDGLCGFYRI